MGRAEKRVPSSDALIRSSVNSSFAVPAKHVPNIDISLHGFE